MKYVYILSNGPGELWDWARPVAYELVKNKIKPLLWLLPCQYASGMERACAELIPFHDVIGPYNWAKTFAEMRKAKDVGLVMQLGGDLMFGRFLSKTSGARLFCYTYGRKRGLPKCSKVFTAYEVMARSIKGDGVYPHVIGDLVADSLRLNSVPSGGDELSPNGSLSSRRVAFFPGSRSSIRRKALPFLHEVCLYLKSVMDVKVVTLLSPFSLNDEVYAWEEAGLNPRRQPASIVLKGVDLALTQPGTNTLELLYLKVPTLVAVPYAFLSDIPFSGFKGALLRLPWIKGKVLDLLSRKRGMLSWPNKILGRELMPELVGDFTPKQIAEAMARFLKDDSWLKETSASMDRFSPAKGASKKLVEEIKQCLV